MCMYVCMYVYIYIYIYTHTHILRRTCGRSLPPTGFITAFRMSQRYLRGARFKVREAATVMVVVMTSRSTNNNNNKHINNNDTNANNTINSNNDNAVLSPRRTAVSHSECQI